MESVPDNMNGQGTVDNLWMVCVGARFVCSICVCACACVWLCQWGSRKKGNKKAKICHQYEHGSIVKHIQNNSTNIFSLHTHLFVIPFHYHVPHKRVFWPFDKCCLENYQKCKLTKIFFDNFCVRQYCIMWITARAKDSLWQFLLSTILYCVNYC